MKKLFYAIAALAIVASCAKVSEVETNVEPKDEKNLVRLIIRTQAPDTKTYIEKTADKTYQPQWNSTDKLGVFFDTVKKAFDAELENTSSDGAKAEFLGNVNASNDSHRVYAYYPSDATISKGSDTQVKFTVPTLQKPAANNFDKNADIAVSRADDIDITGTDVAIDNMVFGRILSTVKVTINNANAGVENDETIQGLMIYAEDSNLTGTLGWDFENEEAQVFAGQPAVSALLKANPINFGTSFFLLVNPTSITPSAEKPLIITIFTNAHTITKTITSLGKDLMFPLGGISELNISTSGATVTEPRIATLVKSPSTLAAGDEVIIVAADYNAVMSTKQNTNNRGQVPAFLYDKESIFIARDTIQRFAVEPGTKSGSFAFKGINGNDDVVNKYIYAASSGSNHLKSQTSINDNASFTVAFEASGVATMTAQGTYTRNTLRYNNTSVLFSCYAADATQKDVVIFRYKEGVYVPSLATPTNLQANYDEGTGTVTVSWNAVDGADSYTVTFTGKETQSGLTSTSTTFTGVTPGTYTITVTAISNDHSSKLDSAAASIEPTFVGAVSYDFTTIAELNALITSTTANNYSGILTSAVVSYAPDTKNAVIKDASGSILYFVNSGHGLLQGQTFSGELTVTAKLYNGASEITACDASFTGAETTVDPVAMTLDQLVDNFSTYQNAYVTVSDLIVTAVSGKNVNVKNGNKTYLVYSNAGNATVEINDIITAVGTVAHYGTNDQIKVWASDNINKTGNYTSPTHTVTINQPSETGCSFNVSVGGSSIASGDSVAEGTTVTLTATAGTGYKFSAWTVTGATVSGNTPSATFVMGESDVTISAAFEVGTEPTYSWVETALADITSSDVFVIVGNNGSNYAMTNNNGTSSAPGASSVTISDSKITSTVSANIKWHLSVDKGNYTFYPGESGTSTWLYCTNTNNGVRVGTNENKVFTISTEGYLVHSGTSRYVGIYSSQDWRCYTSINNNIKDQTFKFYVYKAD